MCVILTGNRGLGPTLASGMLPLPMPRASMLKVKEPTPRPLPAMAAGLSSGCNTRHAVNATDKHVFYTTAALIGLEKTALKT